QYNVQATQCRGDEHGRDGVGAGDTCNDTGDRLCETGHQGGWVMNTGLGARCALAAGAVVVLGLTGSAVAEAGSGVNVTGQKYSDAQSALSGAGMTPVVESTVGDQKAWPDCLVTRTQKRTVEPPENSGGSATTEMLVSLN